MTDHRFNDMRDNTDTEREETMDNKYLENIGFESFFARQLDGDEALSEEKAIARVSEVHREKYKIIGPDGEKLAHLKGSTFYNGIEQIYPAVGDFVLVKRNHEGEDTILKIFDRKSKFSRMDSFNKIEQTVAANFDYVLILTSMNKDYNIKRLDRYLASAWESGATPVIVLTKSDTTDDVEWFIRNTEENAIGVPIASVSSITGEGIDELKRIFKPRSTLVLLGSSGVGKSSLVNALSGKEVMKVKEIREDDSKGRHTTTHRQLITLEDGTMIIDTPGMRELELWDVSEGLSAAFSDIEMLSMECRFKDCKHLGEPGCAVQNAIKSGDLSTDRWNSYLKLKKEAEFAAAKESKSLLQQRKAKERSFGKMQKTFKKNGK
ncbi:ribosome small subunit-dependent GTPase A [Gudongella oleilytica]|jgi:ribosome biogenesis GTPase|uniref:ribosome small subunit-dependent GTPase A n=1 Tax=Gudongella oleilytica TaxID=1582259 RepID=UPI002A36A60A|nr:ribosome small subunit-dependent GTPase A [Gudongella oleilytica]MDY0256069.1 ribosome small subunit-dependent GTPase A [Gudongella oleilytica]